MDGEASQAPIKTSHEKTGKKKRQKKRKAEKLESRKDDAIVS